MAGGPIFPVSQVPITADKVFEAEIAWSGGTQDVDVVGLGVMASLDADAIWRLLWQLPKTFPSGTLKFLASCLSDASSTALLGVAKINPKWNKFSLDAPLQDTAVAAEGTTADATTGGGSTATLEWEIGDNDHILEAKWTMNAGTAPSGGDFILMDLTFETTGWTLGSELIVIPSLIWE